MTTTSNEYVLTERSEKLNAIGAYYESINSPRFLNNDTRLKQLVDTRAEEIKLNFINNRTHNITLVQFGPDNLAIDPVLDDDDLQPFSNPLYVNNILKNLPNKTSAGLDRIPLIVLKHLQVK